MSSLLLEILTPDKTVYWGRVSAVTARALDGEVQILPGHAPYVNILAPGEIRVYTEENKCLHFQGGEGLLEVASDKTSLLIFTPQEVSREKAE